MITPGRPDRSDSDDVSAEQTDGRDESEDQRADRNWNEILQEFRVTQTGTQIISGFLLSLAFQQRFSQLDSRQVTIYVILVFLAAISTSLGFAPVSLHRTLFRHHEKKRIVAISNLLLRVTLVMVSALTAGIVLFILDVAVDQTLGYISGAIMFCILLGLLVVLPRAARIRNRS